MEEEKTTIKRGASQPPPPHTHTRNGFRKLYFSTNQQAESQSDGGRENFVFYTCERQREKVEGKRKERGQVKRKKNKYSSTSYFIT